MSLPLLMAFLTIRTDFKVHHDLPVIDNIPQHRLPEFEKIRGDDSNPPTTPAWYGGDIAAHVDSIDQVLDPTKFYMVPGAKALIVDIEHPRTPIDSSAACGFYLKATSIKSRAKTNLPFAFYDTLLYPELQDFLAPCIYPFFKVSPTPGPTGEGSPAAWLDQTITKLRMYQALHKPIVSIMSLRYWNNDKTWIPDWILDLMFETARQFGCIAVWDNPSSQTEVEIVQNQLTRLGKL